MTNSTPSLAISPRDAKEEKARRAIYGNLSTFKWWMMRAYKRAPHLDLLDDKLMQVTRYIETEGEQGIGRLIVEMPPRHGKTLTVSRFCPAWFIGRNPDKRVMLVSYGASLATKNSRVVRNMIREPKFGAVFPGVELAQDSQSVSEWDIAPPDGEIGTDAGASALGVGGAATGKGAHLLIIDDPIKNREEAESKVYRDKVWDAYSDDLFTRLEPSGAIIVMMTRWHKDDLIGRLLANEQGTWTRLRLPALAEADDPLGRPLNAALWPERFDEDYFLQVQEKRGEYTWSSLYQQRPIARGNELFKTDMIEIVDEPPPVVRRVRFYDLAVTAKASSDYTAGVLLGVTADERVVVLDVVRVQAELPRVQDVIAQTAAMDGADVPIVLEGEKAGIVQLDYLLRDPRMHPHSIRTVAPVGDKYTRAAPIATRVNNGRVCMVRANWNHAFVDELATFPQGRYDDQVDALSGAWHGVTEGQVSWFIM